MKRVLNTLYTKKDSQNLRVKFIYWGIALTKNPLDAAAVYALDGAGTTETPGGAVETGREERMDRYKTFYNFDMENLAPLGEGKYIVICFPVTFGGSGRFEFNGLINNFALINTIIGFEDNVGRVYDLNVFMSYNKYNGYIDELITR